MDSAHCQILRSKQRDSFKSFEFLSTSGKVQIGTKGEGIVVLVGLRKNHFARCQILRSQHNLYTDSSTKRVFNIVKNLFKSIEVLRGTGKVQISCRGEGIFVLVVTKKWTQHVVRFCA